MGRRRQVSGAFFASFPRVGFDAVAADAAGLPPAIGAFLAGTVVGESDFRHQIEDDIRPFRDVLVGLFFVTVGMQIDPMIIVVAPLSVLQWAMVFLMGKFVLVALVAKILGWPNDVAERIGVVLAHGRVRPAAAHSGHACRLAG